MPDRPNTKEINFHHYGVLGSVDWNSNLWKSLPTSADLEKANFSYLKETKETYTFLNFDIDKKIEEDFHSGLVPHLHSRPPQPEYREAIKVVFIRSLNPYNGKNFIVGYYLFPEIKNITVKSPFPDFCETLELCITSKVKHIQLFPQFLDLNVDLSPRNYLPPGSQLGKMGFNYITVLNVENIFKKAIEKNSNNSKLNVNFRRFMIEANGRRLFS